MGNQNNGLIHRVFTQGFKIMRILYKFVRFSKTIFNKLYSLQTNFSNSRNTMNFSDVSVYLNEQTEKQNFSLMFEKGNTWIILKDGIQLSYTDKFNSVSGIIVSHGSFEECELNVVFANLTEQSVFFDIGANVGLYSLSVAHQFKDIEIHAFEPVPDTLFEFKKNLARNRLENKIILNHLAVTDKNGSVYITANHHSSNYLTEAASTQCILEVECITVDTYVEKYSIKKIDFIKIDVEGKELSVLKGAKQALKSFKPILLVELIEKDSHFLDRKCDNYKEVIAFLAELGYKYFIIDDMNQVIHQEKIEPTTLINSFHNYLFYFDHVNLLQDRE